MFRSIRSLLRFGGNQQPLRRPSRFSKNLRIRIEALEDRTAPAVGVAYVNQAWAGFASGASIADADPSLAGNQAAIFGTDAFAGLQGAADAVAPGGTVTLLPGTYSENAALTNPFTLNVVPGTATVSGDLSGTTGLTKAGNGTLVLAGVNTYHGDTTVTRGVLQIGNDNQLGYTGGVVSVTTPGVLEIVGDMATSRTIALNNNATLQVDGGKTLTLSGAEVDGGNLAGPGAIATAGSTPTLFTGTRSASSLALNATAETAFSDFANGGTLNLAAATTFTMTDFTNASSGTMLLSGTADATDFVTNGQITVANTGKLVNVGSSGLTFGGGSVTTVDRVGEAAAGNDGLIDLGGSDARLAGGLLVNNGMVGSFTPGVNLVTDFGGLAKGSGIYGAFLTKNGGLFSPGNSPGPASTSNFNVNGGGGLEFEISNATGTEGAFSGWDRVVVEPSIFSPTPTLNFTATPSSKFSISVFTRLDSGDGTTAGAMSNFNPNHSYSWRFVEADNPAVTVNGTFDPAAFSVITSGGIFVNPIDGTFSVAYRDTDGNSVPDSLFLVYTPNHGTPAANADSYTTNVNVPLSAPAASGVLANDTNPNFGSLSVTQVNGTAIGGSIPVTGGAVVMNANGSFTFTPTLNFSGAAAFNYTLSDGLGGADTGTVTIQVGTSVNHAPVALGGTLTATPNTTATGTLAASDPDGNSLTYSIVDQSAAQGTVVITNSATGAYTYTPASNFSGSASFTFKVNDGSLDSNVATISIGLASSGSGGAGARSASTNNFNVNGGGALEFEISNATGTEGALSGWDRVIVEPSIFSPTPTLNFTATPSSKFSINVFTRLDSGDGSTAGAMSNFDPNHSYSWRFLEADNPAVVVNGTFNPAAFSVVTSGGIFVNPIDGTFSVAYRDTDGNSVPDSLFLVYTPNHATPTANADAYTVSVNVPLSVPAASGVLANDTNPNFGTLSVTQVNGTAIGGSIPVTGGAVVMNANGSFTFTPTLNFAGPASFNYTLSDGLGGTATGTVALQVGTVVNHAPVALGGTLTVTPNTTANGTLAASDADGNMLTYSIVDQSAAQGTVVITNAATGAYIYTPASNFSGSASFTFKVNDGSLDSNVATISIALASSGSGAGARSASTSNFNVNGGGGLEFEISNAAGTEGALSGWDRVIVEPSIFNPTPTLDFTATPSSKFSISVFTRLDSGDGSIAGAMSNFDPNHNYSWRFLEADNPAVVVNGTFDPAAFSVVTSGGIFVNPINGTFSVAYRDTDGNSVPDSLFLVYTANTTPLTASNGTLNAAEDTPATGTLVATGGSGSLTYSIVDQSAAHGTVTITNAATGAYTYAPAANYNGPASFTFKANDGASDSNVATVTIAVSAVNDAPVAANGTLVVAEDASASGTLSASDVDSPNLTYSIVSQTNAHGTVTIANAATGAYTYTPAPDFNGTASFTFKANDGAADSNVATVTITVTSVNDAPVASNGTLTTAEDTLVAGTLVASDVDSVGLTYSIVNQANAHGTVTITNAATGAYSYAPAADFNGSATFTFKANDGALDSNVATVTITVTAINDAPVAINGTLSAAANSTTTGTLAASDVDSASLTYSIVSQANTHGTVVVTNATTGAYNYTPAPNFSGAASFTFKANDGAADSNIATVTITVVNSAPVAFNGTLNTAEDTVAIGTLVATDPDSISLTYSVVSQTNAHGTVTITNPATGAYSYTPTPDFNGTASFTFKANDSSLDSNVATVTIAVAPINDAPVAVNGTLATSQGAVATGTLMASDIDSTNLTYSIVSQANAHGTVTITNAATGAYSYAPAANFSGSASFTFKANDGALDSNVATVTINVSAVNGAPVAANGTLTTAEDTAATGTLSASDADSPTLTYSIVSQANAHGTVTLTNPATGAYNYTPAPDFNGTASFTFKANDGALDSNVATVTIAVAAVNDAPAASNGTLSTAEDTPATGTLSASDVDNSTLTYSIVSQANAHGTVTLTNPTTGAYSYTPAPDFNGSASFTFKANDGALDSNVATVTIAVAAVNDAPVAVNGTLSTAANAPATGTLVASDVDSASLTYSIVSQANAHGTVTLTNAATGAYSFTPAANFSGSASFTFKANDGALDSNVATVTIAVAAVNGAPVAANGTLTTAEDTAATGTLVASDADSPTLTYSIVSQANAHGTVTLTNPTTGAYSYTPAPDFNGSASFTFKANDGALDSNVATVTIAVTPVNDAPVASNGSLTTAEDTFATGTLLVSDVDSTNLTYSIVSQANAHGTVTIMNPATGAYSYTPAPDFNGSASFTFKANDGALDSNVATVTIAVTAVNDAPVAVGGSLSTATNVPATGTLVASDVDNSSLTYSIVSQANAHGTVTITNAATGAYSYTPAPNFSGSASFTFKANDGALDSNVATVTIAVAAVTATTTTLGATPMATTGDKLVMLTAAVAPSPGTVGSVTFLDQGAPIPGGANVPLSGGVAIFSTLLPATGNHPITAVYNGSGNFQSSTSNTQVITVAGAPQVASVTPNGNLPAFAGAQRSRVVNMTVAFSQAVQLDTNAITLALHTNNVSFGGSPLPAGLGTLPTNLVLKTTDNITWTVTFSGNTDVGTDGFESLKDGVYDLNIDAAKVHPVGLPSINMSGNSTTVFYRLFGDTDGPTATPNGSGTNFTAIVNSTDNLAFRSVFNNASAYKAYLDFNGDGLITTVDNFQFRLRFNKLLTWSA